MSISATDVALLGTGTGGQTGIYDLTDGQLVKPIAVGDTISGRTVTGLNFTRSGLFGDPIAFQATFNDGSQGLYTSTVVAPPFALRITAVARLGDDLRLSFNSLAGTNYVIQSRTDLASGSWATLAGRLCADTDPQRDHIFVGQRSSFTLSSMVYDKKSGSLIIARLGPGWLVSLRLP